MAKVQWCVCGWTNIRISRCLCRWVFGSWCWCGGQKVQLCSLLSSLSFIDRNSYCNIDMTIWDKIALQVVISNYSGIYIWWTSFYIPIWSLNCFFFELFYIDIYFALPLKLICCSQMKIILHMLSFLWVSTITKKAFYPKQVGYVNYHQTEV